MNENSDNEHIPWHAVSKEEVRQRVDAGPGGLTEEQALERLEIFGKNELETKEERNILEHIIRQLRSPLIYLLAAAAVISLFIGHYLDASLIAVIVVLNTILGVVQEWRAERALAALREMSAPNAGVFRDGEKKVIPSSAVVPGDILLLESGDRVAADARVLENDGLEADESTLTGESQPVPKESEEVDEDTPLADRSNMVWMSTVITNGNGKAQVVATGMRTEMGKIAGEVREVEREQTPLQRRLAGLGKVLGAVGIGLGILVLGLGLLRGYTVMEMVLFALAVVVSAVPAGLPAVISVTLALGVQRMAERNAIVRRLPSVEALGSTTVICADKTGTITENAMTVTRVWAGGRSYEVTGLGFEPIGEIRPVDDESGEENRSLDKLVAISILANNAEIKEEDGEWQIDGDPTEGAIKVFAHKTEIDLQELEEKQPRLDEIPFSSDLKYMATLHPAAEGDKKIAYIKGAPERIIDFCSHMMEDGERVEVDGSRQEKIQKLNEEFAGQALRVMAGALREFDSGKEEIAPEDVESGLTFVGLWGMLDPPREAAIKAIGEAKRAGMHVVMLTGDHALTAAAVARQVGIGGEERKAVTGKEVEGMSNGQIVDIAMNQAVFARVSPSHKHRILQALKERNEIVAMTGDGVNDAPALKESDIGVAMGETGTDVAREAADLVLTDDNFATIVHAIEEGRIIFNNLRNVTFFLITTSLAEILTLTAALVIGLPLPLTAVMIVFINFMTDGACTVPLGVEPKHHDVLSQRPRDPDAAILGRKLILRFCLLAPVVAAGTLGMFIYSLDGGHAYAQAMAFTTLAAFQWFQAFLARSPYLSILSLGAFSNRWLLLGVGAAVLLQIGAVHTEFGQTLFGIAGIAAGDWLTIIPVAALVLLVDEILKRFRVYGRVEENAS